METCLAGGGQEELERATLLERVAFVHWSLPPQGSGPECLRRMPWQDPVSGPVEASLPLSTPHLKTLSLNNGGMQLGELCNGKSGRGVLVSPRGNSCVAYFLDT